MTYGLSYEVSQFFQVIIQGGVGIIILPCPNWSIMPKIGVFSVIIDSLVPLGPHGLIKPHVPFTRVWGTLVEDNHH